MESVSAAEPGVKVDDLKSADEIAQIASTTSFQTYFNSETKWWSLFRVGRNTGHGTLHCFPEIDRIAESRNFHPSTLRRELLYLPEMMGVTVTLMKLTPN
jgi:hypothetical protein